MRAPVFLFAAAFLTLPAGLWLGMVDVEYCGAPWAPGQDVRLSSESGLLSKSPHCRAVLGTRDAAGGALVAVGAGCLLTGLSVRLGVAVTRRAAAAA